MLMLLYFIFTRNENYASTHLKIIKRGVTRTFFQLFLLALYNPFSELYESSRVG